jgi:two-component system nitrogen regulation response regulator GlnG
LSRMGPPELFAETLETPDECAPSDAQRVPTLTILCHPDANRVGEVATLPGLIGGNPVALARGEPPFASPGGDETAPLSDPYLSRKPVGLSRRAGGYRIDNATDGMALVVDGAPVTGSLDVGDEDVENGVVIELARRVAVLLHHTAPRASGGPMLGILGESDGIARVRSDVLRVADLPVSVLVRGESGTGKELVARAIHDASPRRRGACVCVNVATIPESVAASELFGHVRGAFTGATRDHAGYFGRADGGTLFLDEVGDTPAAVQVMLLRALETREIQPLGAQAAQHVDVRLIAATDADLESRVRQGSFGVALLHRLAGYEIALPALRDRRDDVARLLFHFVREELATIGESGRLRPVGRGAPAWMPAALVAQLVRYHWPGNVRQLRNVVRQLVISSRGEPALRVDVSIERLVAAVAPRGQRAASVDPRAIAPGRRPSDIGDEDLIAALRANGFRRGPTAERLGISLTSLYARIDKCPVLRKAKDISADELRAALAACDGDLERVSERLEISSRGLKLRLRELGMGSGA